MHRCSACSFACLGPGDTYFFNSPGGWLRNNLPAPIEALFASNAVQEVYLIAIAPGGDSWLTTYLASNGQPALLRQNLPQGLDAWLVDEGRAARKLATLEVSLGAHGSFFANDGAGYAWENLPLGLNAVLTGSRDANGKWLAGQNPRNVSLGFDGAWICLTENGGGVWDLRGQPGHQCLADYLQSPISRHDADCYLDPHRPGGHVLLSLDGRVGRNLDNIFLAPCDAMSKNIPNWNQSAAPPPYQGAVQQQQTVPTPIYGSYTPSTSQSQTAMTKHEKGKKSHAVTSFMDATSNLMQSIGNSLSSDGGGDGGGHGGDGGGGGGDGGGGAAADGGGGGGGAC